MRKTQSHATAFVVVVSLINPTGVVAQTVNLEQERAKTLSELSSSEIPDPKSIESSATALFALPIQDQQEDELNKLASAANLYANLVGYIETEYGSYKRENYQYKFVTEKVEKASDQYIRVGNRFKDIRNHAFFNLGIKARDSGKKLQALLYFRDVFRLSTFECGKAGSSKCVRWLAEQEMKKLLNLEDITSYVTWQ